VTIASRPQRGTCVRFDFPLDQLAERDFLSENRGPARRRPMTS
jgi:hypothetical protein